MHSSVEITYIDHERKSEIKAFLNEWDDDNDFILAQTSGSTGVPKSIELQKKHMIASAKKTLDFFQLKSGQTAYLPLSTATIAGKMMVVRAIVGKLKLIIGPISSDSLLHYDQKLDFTAVVPLQLEHALTNDSSRLHNIKNILVGGAQLSDQLIKTVVFNKLCVFQSYGMTETMSHVAIRKIDNSNNLIYYCLNDINLSINSRSELIIHAPDLGIDALQTNDIVELHTSTSFTWLGRSDFVINSGGKKIFPETVEKKLSNLIQVPYFIYGVPDDHLGTTVVLIIESAKKIMYSREDFESFLEKFELPKRIIFIEQFARTTSHKIDRKTSYLRPHVAQTVL